MWKAKLVLNEHNILYNHSPITIEVVVDVGMQQWLFGVVGDFLCARNGTLCPLNYSHLPQNPLSNMWFELLFNKPIFMVSTIVSHGDLPMRISMIKWSVWGVWTLLYWVEISRMETPKDIYIIHGVLGIFVFLSRDAMCVCNYSNEHGSVGHD